MESPIDRYSRHVLLKVVGREGQAKIEQSRVLVAGLGALGSLIAILLARAGVGFLRIVDGDSPELHNLHRQILYDEADVISGRPKAEIARQHLIAANSQITVESVSEFIEPHNVADMLEGMDLVVDALDNTRTRYLINDAIIDRGVPYVFGGAVETVGNVMSIIPGRTPCLRCLWPDPQAVDNHPRASTVGVLSAVATAVASFEVSEAMKIMVGRYDDVLSGLVVMELWGNQFHIVPLEANPACICRTASSEHSIK
ncbi:MAG: HesA/MoeB/ThiF family protein [Desulfomonile sp.]|jgi:adenylyltransferase/sulfurtransferase|nr:HesA/MoeB/ThiF family protein [Deltaproteobacteria bacterium]